MSSPASAVQPSEIILTLPDGSARTYPSGTTGAQVATQIAVSLGKAAIAIKCDGVLCDLSLPLTQNAKIEIVKREGADALDLVRHDCAHVLAQAVQELWPDTQVTIGPVIENGFYYDFYRAQPFTTDDFEKIEKRMRDIVDRALPIVREVWNRDTAIKFFKDKGEHFKAELISDLPPSEEIKIYKQGEWLDLCRGPHLPSTKQVGHAFKLMKVAGAYWRGDSNREVLTRIYGTCWLNDVDLQAHLVQIEEAEKRDHRKLGREMDLFHLQDEAQGSVFWHPRGFVIYHQLEQYIRRRLRDAGYVEVKTPQLMDSKFWEASGHWGKYRENMFVVPDVIPNTEEGEDPFKGKKIETLMALKPMNCPAHVQIFKQGIQSYRDLPIRMAEFGCCHRNEAHGALHGLMRVRQFTQDDAHIFCREDQIFDEAKQFMELFFACYKDLGFDNITLKVATRPEKYAGTIEVWDRAEKILQDVLIHLNIPFEMAPGDGAFYGPKYEFHIKDAIGRSWTCGTFQLDFVLPERLDAAYVGEDGQKHRPAMLHRAILGSIERFVGIMIENYAGKLPVWLAPTQVVVTTITSEADGYAQELRDELHAKGLRVELDLRNEKINYKVREHSLMKVPYLFVVGAREAQDQTVAIRTLGGDAQTVKSRAEAILELENLAKPPY